MNPSYFDIHSHLTDAQFDADRADMLSRLREHNVKTITVGTDYETSCAAVELAQSDESVYACIGMHPDEHASDHAFDLAQFDELARAARVVTIGECGLDYFRAEDKTFARQSQLPVFEAQIALAMKYDLPLMLHIRPSRGSLDAYDDVLDILSSYAREYPNLRGNAHFFAADVAHAKKFFEFNFTISFTGVITFARDYDEVIKYAPLDRIHAETDAPYVAPAPYRGARNEPAYVTEVVKMLAQIRGVEEADMSRALAENSWLFLGRA